MDLQQLEDKAKADESRILDGTKAEVGKGVAWYESHKVIAIAAAVVLAVIVLSVLILKH